MTVCVFAECRDVCKERERNVKREPAFILHDSFVFFVFEKLKAGRRLYVSMCVSMCVVCMGVWECVFTV